MSFNYAGNFPYQNPRPIQLAALEKLQENWTKYDCFVISAPTAFGKTAVARTLMSALGSVSCITPTNQLVEQFREEFPDTPTLARMDSYWCDRWQRPASITRAKLGGFCRRDVDCPGCRQVASDLSIAKYRRGPGIYNYHLYLAHRLYRDCLIVDEAHNLIPTIRDRMSLIIWQHDYRYPQNMRTTEQMREWLETLTPRQRAHKKIALLWDSVTSPKPHYMVERTTELFAGKGTIRGQPEERDCLKLLPVDIGQAPPLFWPREVGKVVLMSATIGPKDISALGLDRHRRVLYIDCTSPIPAENRPIRLIPTAYITRGNITQVLPALADKIGRIAEAHPGEKGVIHATYQLAELLRPLLRSDRYIFHDRDSKRSQYLHFRESPPSDGRILVASGMYEGIDLPEDLGRWQVIAKVPWLSLGNPGIRYLAEQDPEWFTWETLKVLIQACGRICRTPEDFGITYILDNTIERLFRDADHMIPDWYREALDE